MTATLDAAPATHPAPPHDPPARDLPWRTRILPPTDGRGGWLAALAIGLIGGLLRIIRLDIPRGRIFDEIYYACDAQNLIKYGVEIGTQSDPKNPQIAMQCLPSGQPGFIVHPPLGKWLIGLGMKIFGVNEFGWRIAAAVAGTIMIVALVRITRRMTGSTLLGCLAGLLLSIDGLHFVQSRVAMLDIFLAMWVLLAFGALVIDRDKVREKLAATPGDALTGWGPRLGLRPWLIVSGACLGAAVATKWSGLYSVFALILLGFAFEVGARRTAGVRAPVRSTLLRSSPLLLVAMLVLPAALYVLSWYGWFASSGGYDRQWALTNPGSGLTGYLPEALRSWLHYHHEIYGFHDNLAQTHPYQSHPVGWLLLIRPVSYYYPPGIGPGQYGCVAASCAREVLAIGTPVIWWGFTAAIVALLWLWIAKRDWRAAAVLVMVVTTIAPWIRDDLKQRTMFLFYALPAVPFMCLGLALVAGWALGGAMASARRRTTAAIGVGAFTAAAIVNFAFFYPILAAQTLPIGQWMQRIWFGSWI